MTAMSQTSSGGSAAAADAIAVPTLHHVNLKTPRLQEMIDCGQRRRTYGSTAR